MVTLTGPVLFPGDDEPWVGADVKVRLVAGTASALAHVHGTARAGVWKSRTDASGDFSVSVPALPTDDPDDVNPAQAYYEVTVGGGRFPKYLRKIKPTTDDTSYVVTDPEIAGETEDLLPPEFVQVVPEIDDAAVAAYFEDNPIDVSTLVADALAADPPLTVANNGSDITDAAAFRLAIGAASDTDVAALISALADRVATLELFINSNIFVTAEGVTSVVLTFPSGVPTFTTT